jgi:hypothetical protein
MECLQLFGGGRIDVAGVSLIGFLSGSDAEA